MGQPAQHGQPPADRVRTRREPFVRQGLPRREPGHRRLAEQRAQGRGQFLGLPAGRGDRQQGPVGPGSTSVASAYGRRPGAATRSSRGRVPVRAAWIAAAPAGSWANASSRPASRPSGRSAAHGRAPRVGTGRVGTGAGTVPAGARTGARTPNSPRIATGRHSGRGLSSRLRTIADTGGPADRPRRRCQPDGPDRRKYTGTAFPPIADRPYPGTVCGGSRIDLVETTYDDARIERGSAGVERHTQRPARRPPHRVQRPDAG